MKAVYQVGSYCEININTISTKCWVKAATSCTKLMKAFPLGSASDIFSVRRPSADEAPTLVLSRRLPHAASWRRETFSGHFYIKAHLVTMWLESTGLENATVRFSFSHDFLQEVGRTAKFPFAVRFHQRGGGGRGGTTCCKLSEQCVHLYLNSKTH